MRKVKIKITKCSRETYWYNSCVGKILNATKFDDFEDYLINFGDNPTIIPHGLKGAVTPEDCVEIPMRGYYWVRNKDGKSDWVIAIVKEGIAYSVNGDFKTCSVSRLLNNFEVEKIKKPAR